MAERTGILNKGGDGSPFTKAARAEGGTGTLLLEKGEKLGAEKKARMKCSGRTYLRGNLQ